MLGYSYSPDTAAAAADGFLFTFLQQVQAELQE